MCGPAAALSCGASAASLAGGLLEGGAVEAAESASPAGAGLASVLPWVAAAGSEPGAEEVESEEAAMEEVAAAEEEEEEEEGAGLV